MRVSFRGDTRQLILGTGEIAARPLRGHWLSILRIRIVEGIAAISSPSAARPSQQFTTVHALRGFAAFWVVLFHVRNYGAVPSSSLVTGIIFSDVVFGWGRGGVAIFFVLSGFVIAHSLARAEVNGAFLGRFMLRRSVRLDPPYWASMAVVIAITSIRAARGAEVTPVSPGLVAAHILYLQEILRLPEIEVVYWTLTYEIQFYFVYALLLWWTRRTSARLSAALANIPAALLLAAAFVAAAEPGEWVLHGLFLNYWDAFAAGVLAYYGGHRKNLPALLLCLLCSGVMLVSAPLTAEVFNTPAALTAISLALLGRFDRLCGFTARPLRHLGTISYSLYLIHVPAILVALSLTARMIGAGPEAGWVSFVLAISFALAGASAFWWLFERPSHAFAKRISATGQGPAQPAR